MSHVVVPNYPVFSASEPFNYMWKLTRAMLAAGWRYKASSDATGAAKEVSGLARTPQREEFAADRWGVGGGVNLIQVGAQTGTAPQMAAASSGNSIITLVSGFTANSVGRFLTIANALNAGNNGTFRIVAQSGTSVTVFNPSAVLETGTAGVTWTEKHGGAGASIAAVGTAGAIPGRAILTGLTGMVSPTTTPLSRGSVGDRVTIIGAATAGNNGTFLITRVISATSVEIDNPVATSDANNAALIWAEISPLSQVYGLHLQAGTGVGAWICLQGPSTLKIPMGTNVPSGTFLKGEVINQTTSGAQGVILGVCPDTAGGLGYIVVEPRLSGTGNGVRGWSIGADTITGATTGTTLAIPSPTTPIEFTREMVVWKNVAATGHVYFQTVALQNSGVAASITTNVAGTMTITGLQNMTASSVGQKIVITGAASAANNGAFPITAFISPTSVSYTNASGVATDANNPAIRWVELPAATTIDAVGENAARFSWIATLAATTAAVCPGGATNTFPAPGTWVLYGNGGGNTAATNPSNWLNAPTLTTWGNAQIMCANCIEGSGVSMDGSWIIAAGTPATSGATYVGNAFMRMDDGEEGDVDPYVTWVPSGTAAYAVSRTLLTSASTLTDYFKTGTNNTEGGAFMNLSATYFKGWRRRGFPTGDAFQEFGAYQLGSVGNSGNVLTSTNPYSPGRVLTQATTNQAIREPVWIISTQLNSTTGVYSKMRKGQLRWCFITEGGVGNTTYYNATAVQLGTPQMFSATIGSAGIVSGLWDGISVPTNA